MNKEHLRSLNDLVICKPKLDVGGIKQELNSGFVKVVQKIEITGLEVLVDFDTTIRAGDTVYVKESSLSTSGWAKTILRLEGVEVILVPKTELVAHSQAGNRLA